MKKSIATQLNEVADTMPIVFEWFETPEVFTGKEMNLSAFGEHQKFDPEKTYVVMMPALIATEHKHQIKDAYKRGGFPAVKEYHSYVISKIKTNAVNSVRKHTA